MFICVSMYVERAFTLVSATCAFHGAALGAVQDVNLQLWYTFLRMCGRIRRFTQTIEKSPFQAHYRIEIQRILNPKFGDFGENILCACADFQVVLNLHNSAQSMFVLETRSLYEL